MLIKGVVGYFFIAIHHALAVVQQEVYLTFCTDYPNIPSIPFCGLLPAGQCCGRPTHSCTNTTFTQTQIITEIISVSEIVTSIESDGTTTSIILSISTDVVETTITLTGPTQIVLTSTTETLAISSISSDISTSITIFSSTSTIETTLSVVQTFFTYTFLNPPTGTCSMCSCTSCTSCTSCSCASCSIQTGTTDCHCNRPCERRRHCSYSRHRKPRLVLTTRYWLATGTTVIEAYKTTDYRSESCEYEKVAFQLEEFNNDNAKSNEAKAYWPIRPPCEDADPAFFTITTTKTFSELVTLTIYSDESDSENCNHRHNQRGRRHCKPRSVFCIPTQPPCLMPTIVIIPPSVDVPGYFACANGGRGCCGMNNRPCGYCPFNPTSIMTTTVSSISLVQSPSQSITIILSTATNTRYIVTTINETNLAPRLVIQYATIPLFFFTLVYILL